MISGSLSSGINSKVALTSTLDVSIVKEVLAELASASVTPPDTTSHPANLYPSLGVADNLILAPLIPDVAEAVALPLPSLVTVTVYDTLSHIA